MRLFQPSDQRSRATRGKRFKRCLIHIGTEKTGTSAIQTFLRRNDRALLRERILYPRALGEQNASQWELVAAVHDSPWRNDIGESLSIANAEDQEVFREQLKAALEAEFNKRKQADTLLVSSEHLHSRLAAPETVARLKAFLNPWVEDYAVIVYFRRQDEVAIASQSTRVKSGNPYKDVIKLNLEGTARDYFDYEKIYATWASVFGRQAMRTRLYGVAHWEDGDLIADFCKTAGISSSGKTKPEPVNRSLNRNAFHFIQELNRKHVDNRDPQHAKDVANIRREISNSFPGKYYPVSRSEAEAFYREFADANERLRKAAFPEKNAPLFDEDFSDYPETAHDVNPAYGDAVDIAVQLWRLQNERSLAALAYDRMRQLIKRRRRR